MPYLSNAPFISDADWAGLRRHLHRYPELSDRETETARFIVGLMQRLEPDEIVTGLGGEGVAAVFNGAAAGPTTLIRCELDALPVRENSEQAHRSTVSGVSHQCGHDGHMAIVVALAADLARHRPAKGRVVLLYQPAEETGAGAGRVVADPAFARLKPDFAFALHNVPGLPLGEVAVKPGPINCASRGMIATLSGSTSHAAHPEHGISPAQAMSRIIQQLESLPTRLEGRNWVTVVHARLGEKTFGTAPGEAIVMATLRTETDAAMTQLVEAADRLIAEESRQQGLDYRLAWEDVFAASTNDEAAYAIVHQACRDTGTPFRLLDAPYRWSEDFGRLSQAAGHGALFALGSGVDCPQIHSPDYDFPDALIPIGTGIFRAIISQING